MATVRTAANSKIVGVRVTLKESKWIEHYARLAGKKPGGWIYQLIRERLIEEAQKA